MIRSNRADWGFEETARDTFACLCDSGFVETECGQSLMHWNKGDVGVTVYQGRQSCEIGIEISYRGQTYSLQDVIRAIDPEFSVADCIVTPVSKDAIASAMRHLRELLIRFGAEALEGSAGFFSRLEESRTRWVDSYWLEARARTVRPQAEEAFRSRDYARVVELYGQIFSCLSKAELKKLEIAQGKLNSQPDVK